MVFICLFKLQFEFVGAGVVTLPCKSDGPRCKVSIRSFLFENNTFISCADYPPLIVGTGVMTLLRKSDGPKYRSSHNLVGTGVLDGPKYIWDIRSFLVRTRNEPKKPPMGVPLGTPAAVRIFKMRTGSK